MKSTKIFFGWLLASLALLVFFNPYFAYGADRIDAISAIDTNSSNSYTQIRPGTVYTFPLTADMFTQFAATGSAGAPIALSQLRGSNIDVKYTCNRSNVVKEISLITAQFNGVETACVKLEFAEKLVSVKPVDFKLTLYLTVDGKRNEASAVTISSKFENEEMKIDKTYDSVSIASGQVLSSSAYIAELDIDIGADVHLFARIQEGQKYYAVASNALENSDNNMIEQFPKIVTAIHIRAVNLRPVGNCISMNDIGYYYVYTGNGVFLGDTTERLPYHDLYYLTSEKIVMNTQNDGGANDGYPLGGISGNTQAENAARKEMQRAVADSLASNSKLAKVVVKNVAEVTSGELRVMFETATLAKLRAEYVADTLLPNGTAVQGRIVINPALAVRLDRDILLGVYISGEPVEKVAALFNRSYSNALDVISLSHDGSYGMPVRIVAKVANIDVAAKNLYFYSYDAQSNSFKRLTLKNSHMDKSGYLYFDTVFGGYIIVSEGALVKR